MQDEALQDALREEAHKELARRRILDFTKYTFSRGRYAANFHHSQICLALDDVVNDKLHKLIVVAPPRGGKSELVSRRLPAFYHGRHPSREIIAATFGGELSEAMARDTKGILNSEEYQELFPEFEFGSKNALMNYDTAQGGRYLATSIGGSITGFGAHLLIVDDPIKGHEEAQSATQREKAYKWLTSDAFSRLMRPRAVVILATRWHEDDPTGRILESAQADGWRVLEYPAIQDREPTYYDPRPMGTALWRGFDIGADEYILGQEQPCEERPNPVTTEELEARALEYYLDMKEVMDPYEFESLYQGNPVPREGTIVNPDDFLEYTGSPRERAVHCDELIISVDANFKKTATSDFASLAVFGRTRSPNAIYLIDEVHDRLSFPQLKDAAKKLAARYPNAKLLIESKANGQALIDALKSDGYLRVVGFEPTKHGSKEIRFQVAADIVRSGQVYLPKETHAPWVKDWKADIVGFGSRKHDDRADSFSMVCIEWLGRPSGLDHLRRITQGYRANSAGKLRI